MVLHGSSVPVLLGPNLFVTNDRLSCESSTGGWKEKDMMTCGPSPGGLTEVMFWMHVLWHLVFLPRQISNNGMRSNDPGGHARVALQRGLSLSFLSSLSSLHPFFHFMNPEHHHTMPYSRAYSRPCGWC